eukprot:CAMPEP_0172694390 /NCGR_PEP_ID=MMETSP1074-20121228/26638_1 /TAXON_ID=2916 /ORGANISM="Ceratium fusus, Strain PA161109" /LENGTH=89 /DNA_ID=CAMNT_0013514889 /DNA_START=203 /DNA_END=472 /DNA_ORIENTATION=-
MQKEILHAPRSQKCKYMTDCVKAMGCCDDGDIWGSDMDSARQYCRGEDKSSNSCSPPEPPEPPTTTTRRSYGGPDYGFLGSGGSDPLAR